jgi:cyclin B
MFEYQKKNFHQNIGNIPTKTQITQFSEHKEKNISLFGKKVTIDHREFGNDITNIALTAFENKSFASNKTILKAIEIIKANQKNKERSREKSLKKNKIQMIPKDGKNSKKELKKPQNWKMAQEKAYDRKKSKLESKKSETISLNEKTNYTNNISENDKNINISEFDIGKENEKNNSFLYKKEEKYKNEIISRINEINIKIDLEDIPVNHFHCQKNNLIIKKKENINTKFDLQYVKEYQEEIIEYLLSLEQEKRINPNYMVEQNDINEKMRIILIDWLIEVHLKFKLLAETLFLTINFIDRYLQKNQTPRNKLQLIAVSSLLIACKYEEIYPPELSSFVYITDNAYKTEEILDYEQKILESLEYDVTYPTPLRYLEILVIKLGLINDEMFYNKMQYLIELSLTKLSFYNYSFLELVISCCLLLFENDSNRTQNILLCFDLYDNIEKIKKIKNCICEIKNFLEYLNQNKTALKGLRQKFSMEKYGCVSKLKLI